MEAVFPKVINKDTFEKYVWMNPFLEPAVHFKI